MKRLLVFELVLPALALVALTQVSDAKASLQGGIAAPNPPAPIALADTLPDFNGDGFGDLAVGVVFDDVPTRAGLVSGGAVNVLYGSAAGLGSTGAQLWHQDRPGVADLAEGSDQFGAALAWGDFNGDGFVDLAVGAPNEDLAGKDQTGGVNVLYGSPSGLSSTGNQFWHQDNPNVPGVVQEFDYFGTALAAGDFDNDGFSDLAVGAVGDKVPTRSGTVAGGAVNILYGSASGLRAQGAQIWHQNSLGVVDVAEITDNFGEALTAGDFDGDGFADLAVGISTEVIGNALGAAQVLYGSAGGLAAAGNQLWYQDSPGIPGTGEGGDRFGFSLVAADFDFDGFADLAVGVPFEDLGNVQDVGAVNVIYGSGGGLASAGAQLWTQDVSSVVSVAQHHEEFGRSVAASDFDGDHFADLAVGVPGERLRDTGVGGVSVLYGSTPGLTGTGSQLWHQSSSGIVDVAEISDRFGKAVAAANFDGDLFADLAVGVPGEDPSAKSGAGALNALYGASSGLASAGNQFWHQDSPGIPGVAETSDDFGGVLPNRSR